MWAAKFSDRQNAAETQTEAAQLTEPHGALSLVLGPVRQIELIN